MRLTILLGTSVFAMTLSACGVPPEPDCPAYGTHYDQIRENCGSDGGAKPEASAPSPSITSTPEKTKTPTPGTLESSVNQDG